MLAGSVVLVPVAAGLVLWAWRPARRPLGAVAVGATVLTVALAVRVVLVRPDLALAWGPGLVLRFEAVPIAGPLIVLVPLVATPVVAYAAAHEPSRGLARLVGLLLVFVGTMELVALAADLLTLLIGWELIGALSWGLIAHDHRGHGPAGAAHAFNVTRFGDVGLFLAAGAAFSATGTVDFAALTDVSGPARTVLVAGVLVAAMTKSAQAPFAPWLGSAMRGPTSVSALLHSATVVAAGVYLLARLQPMLATVTWFGSATIAAGLVTAVAGGVVAALQDDAKRLLAASTSAHHGLMLVAVGAGYPVVAIAHLVAHGLCKSLLFLSSGVAISAAGSRQLALMGLGRALRPMAALTAVGTVALAAVPPLGAAWTKEQVVAAGVGVAPWVGVGVIVAGGLSAFYATRFQLLAYGAARDRHRPLVVVPGAVEHVAVATLGVAGVALGALWVPDVQVALARAADGALPTGATWELVGSLMAVCIGGYAALTRYRSNRLAGLVITPIARATADWFAIPAATAAAVVTPTLRLAAAMARFDDHVVDGAIRRVAGAARGAARGLAHGDDRIVDAGVRGVAAAATRVARLLDSRAEWSVDAAVHGLAWLVGSAARDSRRTQTGQTHTYYAVVAVGTIVLMAATAVWSL